MGYIILEISMATMPLRSGLLRIMWIAIISTLRFPLILFLLSSAGYSFFFFLAKLDVILEPFHVLLCKLQGSPAAVSWRVTGNVMALQLVFVKRSLLLIRVSALLAVQGSTLSRELHGEPAGLWGMRRGAFLPQVAAKSETGPGLTCDADGESKLS